MEQGSAEWHQARCGMVTCSKLSALMTRGGFGKATYTYMWDKIAEIITKRPQDEVKARALDWGNEWEPEARAMYCHERDVRVVKVGFLVHPEISCVGGSPDGLVEGDPVGPGGVEIKCPLSSRIHLSYTYEGGVPKDYYHQVQGLMWVTGRRWWDFVSYDHRMPGDLKLFIHREAADEELHAEYTEKALRFAEQVQVRLKKLRGKEDE